MQRPRGRREQGLRMLTERSPRCLLNTGKGETESKTEIMGKAQNSGQILIKKKCSLSLGKQAVSAVGSRWNQVTQFPS